MDIFIKLFWLVTILFIVLAVYLQFFTKETNTKETNTKETNYNKLFWGFTILFVVLSVYLHFFTQKFNYNIFYLQIASWCGIFATTKIGRNFLGLE